MDEEQRDRSFHFTPLMYIMNIESPKPFHFDVTGEHWKFIELAFMRAPVIVVPPFVNESFHIGWGSAGVPASVAYFVGEMGVGEFATKEGNSVIWHGSGFQKT